MQTAGFWLATDSAQKLAESTGGKRAPVAGDIAILAKKSTVLLVPFQTSQRFQDEPQEGNSSRMNSVGWPLVANHTRHRAWPCLSGRRLATGKPWRLGGPSVLSRTPPAPGSIALGSLLIMAASALDPYKYHKGHQNRPKWFCRRRQPLAQMVTAQAPLRGFFHTISRKMLDFFTENHVFAVCWYGGRRHLR